MTTALVTGISGQDGSYLAEQLLSQGVRVVGVHRRLSAENFWRIEHVLDRVELRYADLHDLGSLYDLVEEYRPDEIYNLAAQSFVPTSWSQPILTAEATGLGREAGSTWIIAAPRFRQRADEAGIAVWGFERPGSTRLAGGFDRASNAAAEVA